MRHEANRSMNPSWAITIGAYRLWDFVELNVCRCKVIFGDDVSICIDDDKSPESPKIEAVADKHGCHYICSTERRGHFAGDAQTIATCLAFGKQTGADYSLKLSQR